MGVFPGAYLIMYIYFFLDLIFIFYIYFIYIFNWATQGIDQMTMGLSPEGGEMQIMF